MKDFEKIEDEAYKKIKQGLKTKMKVAGRSIFLVERESRKIKKK
jgi:hypothetical protein